MAHNDELPCKICANPIVAEAFASWREQGLGYRAIWRLMGNAEIGRDQFMRHARDFERPIVVEDVEPPAIPKVLIYDIETSPNLGYVWGKYDQTVQVYAQEWYILSIAYKWIGDEHAQVIALPDFELYKTEPDNDYELVSFLWHLLDQADATVTHNGKNFDKGKTYARMIYHQFPPPTPAKEIDTLQIARREFNFTSNKLGDLCEYLGLEHKQDNGGMKTWIGCLNGDEEAWALMKEYNLQDAFITEQLYLRLQPWVARHPNFSLITDRPAACPKCGAEGSMIAKGWQIYTVTKRHRYQCTNCGGYAVGRKMIKSDVQYQNL
jgi:hypothetical protein